MQSTALRNNITDGQERAGPATNELMKTDEKLMNTGRAGKAVVPNCGLCETRV